ncbi:MAG: phosphatidate cytidylyltransferase [Candidatus Zixiibacteriota bacterium]
MSKNLLTRIVVAAVAIPVILWLCYQGGGWLFGMVLLLSLIAVSEFLLNEGFKPSGYFFWLGIFTVTFLILSRTNFSLKWFEEVSIHISSLTGILIFFLLTAMIFSAGKKAPGDLFKMHSRLLWGVFYIGMLYPYVYLLGADNSQAISLSIKGGDWLLFLFGILWVGDTSAMAFGKWIGRQKLAPAVSPNKTVEGFVGGILGALVIGMVMHFWKFQQLEWYHILIIACGCSIFGQLGDLVESMWKRSLGIKDSSFIVPGHGGILDRFDSLLFAAPFMFYYKILIILK